MITKGIPFEISLGDKIKKKCFEEVSENKALLYSAKNAGYV